MKDFSQQLKEIMQVRGITQTELCERTGIPKSALSQYLSGAFKPKQERTYILAKALHTTPEYLMGLVDESDIPPAKPDPPNAVRLPQEIVRMVPLYESVAAGFGAYADSSAVGIIPCCIESDWEAENSIGIKVKGDSMYPKIEDGDIVVVCKDMDYDDGQIVVARIDEDDAVVKRIHLYPTRLVLESINPEYQDRIFEREEMNRVHREGVVRKIVKNV